jgi:spermidine synthase
MQLYVSVFVSGAVVMALELLGSRLLAPVFGNSIFVWGSLIGVVLSSLSAGYFLGGKLADRRPNLQTLSVAIFAAGLLVLVLPTLSSPILNAIVVARLDEKYSPLLASVILLGPPSTLLGMVSPYAIRLAAKSFEKLGKASGNLYALSTLGSIVGTFVTVFVLIPAFGVNKIILALGATLLVVAFLGLGIRSKVFVLVILITLPIAAPYMITHRLTVATYSLALGDTVYETDTPYHHLLVADAYDPTDHSAVRYLILDDNLHSAMDLSDPTRSVFAYTEYFHLPFLVNPNITRVLFVGGGGFTGPKSFLRYYASVTIDVAEIDPEVISVAEQYFGVDPANPRLHIYNEDGRNFLKLTDQKYDLIILDAYSRSYVPFHLMTVEFFKLVTMHLKPNGAAVSNLIAAISGDSSRLLDAEFGTMRAVFPEVYVFATRGSQYPGVQNIIILASLLNNRLTGTAFQHPASANDLALQLGSDVDNLFVLTTSGQTILTDDFAPVETLLNPLTGEPLGYEETGEYSYELEKITAVVLVALVVFVIFLRKKLL